MGTATDALKRHRWDLLAVLALIGLILGSLHMMSNAVQNSAALGSWFMPLLLITVGGLLALAVLIGFNLFQLLREYRRRVAGSRLAARLVGLFLLLSLVPVSVVYYHSLRFLMHGIDSWFDVQIDAAMEDALNLSRASLDLHKKERLHLTEQLLLGVEDSSQTALALSLGELREVAGADELTLLDKDGRIIASSNPDLETLVPERPDNAILQQVLSGTNYAGLTPWGEDGQLYVRCLVRDPAGRDLLLQAIYPTSPNISNLSNRVQSAYAAYKERAYLRESLKFSFALTLSLVLLASLFAATWAAIYTARRLAAPITDLAEGTRAVAAGDYDKRLPMPKVRDELGFLVVSFNAMTRRIAQARNAAERSQRALEAQRNYLETVLGSLSTGVLALSPDHRLDTANHAASEILRLDLGGYRGEPLEKIAEDNPQLMPLVEHLSAVLHSSGRQQGAEVVLYRSEGRQVLLYRCSELASAEPGQVGHVVVFDDITAMIQAQRNAAWGEVARRLAHEIKNPLTPIQLSAERLRRKCLPQLQGEYAEVLDRATHTIVQQVEAMKAMVNAFSDYAKPSKIEPEPLDINQLMGEVLELYKGLGAPVTFRSGVDHLRVEADPVRLRQVIHNLLKNAQEAVAGRPDGQVWVDIARGRQDDCEYAEIAISDNGPGFEADALGRIFEPYITTKTKGTGLGLAIVKKIIDEHGGIIWAENSRDGGGRVVIRLPALQDSTGKTACDNRLPATSPDDGSKTKKRISV